MSMLLYVKIAFPQLRIISYFPFSKVRLFVKVVST
jgi:hypothetical protein